MLGRPQNSVHRVGEHRQEVSDRAQQSMREAGRKSTAILPFACEQGESHPIGAPNVGEARRGRRLRSKIFSLQKPGPVALRCASW